MNATAPSSLLWFVAGFGLWSLGFVLLYAMHAVGCHWGWHEVSLGPVTLLRVVLAGIFALHVAALAALCAFAQSWWRKGRGNGAGELVRLSALVLSIAALVSMVWTGLPALVLRACTL